MDSWWHFLWGCLAAWRARNVLNIAKIVTQEMDLEDVEIRLTGGVDGGRGWKGGVKLMQLDMTRLRSYGWKPKYSSAEAVRFTARSIIEELRE